FETNDSSSKFIGTIMASVNQFQRDITGEKVLATMRSKAGAGYFPGRAPVGYKNVQNPNATERFARKAIAIDENTAPYVKEAFKLYATGNYSLADVNDILYEKGLRTKSGKKMFHTKFNEMLKSPFYVGELHWGSVDLKEAKHTPLIDRDLFERVQKVLNDHGGHICRKRKFEWLLNGFIRCYKHGGRYTAEWHLKKRIAYYHCTKSGCPRYIEIGKLEEMVADKFKMLEFSKDFIDLVLEKVKNIFYDRRQSYESKRQGLVNQKNAFEARMRTAEDKLLSKTISDDDFTRMRNEIKIELSAIDDKIIRLQREKDIDVDLAREVIGLTDNIYETYKKSSPQLKRLLLGFFWEKFEVHDGLIIKSVSSILFEELIKAEKAFMKNDNTIISNDSNKFINSNEWCIISKSNNLCLSLIGSIFFTISFKLCLFKSPKIILPS
ncbi:MAG: recombinase family protein, partial [Candidatus Zambryskibacteria bacterium]|nr:recombinase family protein [Candidatus Zambryskibacteria bacterium]